MAADEPLHDYGASRAVLIGAWEYRNLPDVGFATRNSLHRMEQLLTGPLCGWPQPTGSDADRLVVMASPPRRGELPDKLRTWFDDVTGVALFYFVGHGQLHEDELCLALAESPAEGGRRTTVGLPFSDAREALEGSPAKVKIVILDCCYSGHATQARHRLGELGDQMEQAGAVTLAATAPYRTAWFEADASVEHPQTYFTQYLVNTIERGLPGGAAGLAVRDVFIATMRALNEDKKPRPTRAGSGDAEDFVLARNVAFQAGTAQTVSHDDRPPAFAMSPDPDFQALQRPQRASVNARSKRAARRLFRRRPFTVGAAALLLVTVTATGWDLFLRTDSAAPLIVEAVGAGTDDYSYGFSGPLQLTQQQLNSLDGSYGQNADYDTLLLGKGGIPLDSVDISISVTANGEQNAEITGLGVTDLRCNAPLSAAAVYAPLPSGSVIEGTRPGIDLDDGVLYAQVDDNGKFSGNFFQLHAQPVRVGGKVSLSLQVVSRTRSCSFELQLVVDTSTSTNSITITDDGKPFEVAGIPAPRLANAPLSGYRQLYIGGGADSSAKDAFKMVDPSAYT